MKILLFLSVLSLMQVVCTHATGSIYNISLKDFDGKSTSLNEEIKQFCSSKYQVPFPLFDKIEVNGPTRHPLYVLLAGEGSTFPGDIKWNFNKFLIGRDGKIVKRFDSR